LKTLFALLLAVSVAAPAWGESSVKETGDRIVIEINGTPRTQQEIGREEMEERYLELQEKVGRLAGELQELRRPEPGESFEMIQQRRARAAAKSLDLKGYQDQLQQLSHQLETDLQPR